MSRSISFRITAPLVLLAHAARRLGALGMAIALTACSGDPSASDEQASYSLLPKKPWSSDHYSSTRLVLERTDSGFRVVSAAPSYGGVTQLNVAEMVPDLLEGRQRLYEYAVRSGASEVLSRGYFTVSLKARATFPDPADTTRIHHEELDDPSRVVRIAIPYAPAVATIDFQMLLPGKEPNFERWQRVSAGSISVDARATGQQQGSEQQ